MSKKYTHDIIQQNAIFDGKPDFIPTSAAICLLNHHSYGGTPNDFKEAVEDDQLEDPRRYKVTMTIEVEEITP